MIFLTHSALHRWSSKALLLMVCLVVCSSLMAQENKNKFNLLLLPTNREVSAKLKQGCQLWAERPLHQSLKEMQKVYGITIWLDRRIDSEQLLLLSRSDNSTTLLEELNRVAIGCGVQGGLVENIYVMAPNNRLARLQRAAVVLHGQIANTNASLAAESRELKWPDITSSNELLQLIAQNWNINLGDSSIPHDLLHEGQLPKCSLATQLTLLLAGFDLQAVLDTKSNGSADNRVRLRIEPLSSETSWSDSYERTPSETVLNELRTKYPSGSIELAPKATVKVRGETNLHFEVLYPIASKRPTSKRQETRMTFDVQAPVPAEVVLSKLAKDLDFKLIWSSECTSKHRNRTIQLKVVEATRSELIKEVCDAAELRAVENDRTITVYPK